MGLKDDIIIFGIIGTFTFQIPFWIVFFPQLLAWCRMVPTENAIHIVTTQAAPNDMFTINCKDVSILKAMPQCFDPSLASYGFCEGTNRAELFKAYRAYDVDDQHAIGNILNPTNLTFNPSLMNSIDTWCSKPHFYDPHHIGPWYYSKFGVVDGAGLYLLVGLGGMMGFLIVPSFLLPVYVAYLLGRWFLLPAIWLPIHWMFWWVDWVNRAITSCNRARAENSLERKKLIAVTQA